MCKRCTYMNIWSVITQAMGNGGRNHANLFTFSRHMRFVFSMYELNQKQFLFTSNISTKETKSAGFI